MSNTEFQHFSVRRNEGRVFEILIDVRGRSVNIFNDEVMEELERVLQFLESETPQVVVFRSLKTRGFFAGADVSRIAELRTAAEALPLLRRGQQLFARIENLNAVTVAAIHGPCLGGGLELALACDYRIALDAPSTKLGLPEVQLGLIPGWGGTQRLPRLIGIMSALPMILKGTKLSAGSSLKSGLVDMTADQDNWEPSIDAFCRKLTTADPNGMADRSRSMLQRLIDSHPGRWVILRTAESRIRREGRHYPALPAAIRCVAAAFDNSVDGFEVERNEFGRLLQTPTCRNLLKLYTWREKARSLRDNLSERADLPIRASVPENRPEQIGIVGAGAMGAGIGQLAALKGYKVVLKELTPSLAADARQKITRSLNSLMAKGKLRSSDLESLNSRIQVVHEYDSLAACEVVIEAAVEDLKVKQAIFRDLDSVLQPKAVIASNTSALSISEMARATNRPSQIAGLHFFNPVHRMDLVELIRTERTNDQTTRRLMQLVRSLGKTPVVTTDTPGFLVNRVLFPYIGEAVRMVSEGVSCSQLDHEARTFGMPMGPIELIDHVGLDVAWHVAEALSDTIPDSKELISALGQMVARGWRGKKSGRGFYVYADGRRRSLNPDLKLAIPASQGHQTDAVYVTMSSGISGAFVDDGLTSIQRRLVYPMINEAAWCLQENVVTGQAIADLAIVLGTGFAPFRGGPLTLMYSIGVPDFLNNLKVLVARHGNRFKPAAWLVDHRNDNTTQLEQSG